MSKTLFSSREDKISSSHRVVFFLLGLPVVAASRFRCLSCIFFFIFRVDKLQLLDHPDRLCETTWPTLVSIYQTDVMSFCRSSILMTSRQFHRWKRVLSKPHDVFTAHLHVLMCHLLWSLIARVFAQTIQRNIVNL